MKRLMCGVMCGMAVCGLSLTVCGVQAPKDAPFLTYRPPDGKAAYYWDNLADWDTRTTDDPATHLPTSTDNVFLYSSKNKITNGTGKPMLVTNGVDAATSALYIGDHDNGLTIGVRVCDGGTMTNDGTVYAGAGRDGAVDESGTQSAWLEVERGGAWTAKESFFLGATSGTSWLNVKEGGTLGCSNEFVVGRAHGIGIVTNAGTMTVKNFFIGGYKATGQMELTGKLTVQSKFTLGRYEDSSAYLHIAKDAVLEKAYVDGKPMYIGNASNCNAVIEFDADFAPNDTRDRMYFGNQSFATGRMIVNEGVTVGSLHSLYLGVTNNAFGTLELHGGTVKLQGSSTVGVQKIFIGDLVEKGDVTRGRIVGHGAIRSGNNQNLRIQPYGQFVADGFGTAHDLNLAEIRTVGTNASDKVNGCHTNGWFAVNKGRLLYPRGQNCTANSASHPTVGDYPTRGTPTMMNSLRYSFGTPPQEEYYNFAELYATDREDIPAGLPSGKDTTVAGVWRLGFSRQKGADIPPDPLAFANLRVSFRYDDRNLTPVQKVSVYRHDGTANGTWRRVSPRQAAYANETTLADNLIRTEDVQPSTEAWNAGWFAVVAEGRTGLFVIVR